MTHSSYVVYSGDSRGLHRIKAKYGFILAPGGDPWPTEVKIVGEGQEYLKYACLPNISEVGGDLKAIEGQIWPIFSDLIDTFRRKCLLELDYCNEDTGYYGSSKVKLLNYYSIKVRFLVWEILKD